MVHKREKCETSALVNLQIERRASWVGAQVPRVFCRQKSLRVALMETTTLRSIGWSGLATLKLLPSASASGASEAVASPPSIAASGLVGAAAFSERTDIRERSAKWGVRKAPKLYYYHVWRFDNLMRGPLLLFPTFSYPPLVLYKSWRRRAMSPHSSPHSTNSPSTLP